MNEVLAGLSKALILIDKALLELDLALNNNPPPDTEMDLRQRQSDLQTLRSELDGRRNALEGGAQVISPPDSTLMAQIQSVIWQVEAAKNASDAANARLAAAGKALDLGIKIAAIVGPWPPDKKRR